MKGTGYEWIVEHSKYQEDWCLIFPLARLPGGYGTVSVNGQNLYAHRVMCEMVNGPAPSDKHEAAHECGNGDRGCCNPKHLLWKTRSENLEDRTRHGTKAHGMHRVTQEMAAAIMALKGKKTRDEISAEFGVSVSTVSDIHHGRTHGPNRRMKYLSEADAAKIRELSASGKNYSQMARAIGFSPEAVKRLAKKMGLEMNYKPWAKGTKTTDLDLT